MGPNIRQVSYINDFKHKEKNFSAILDHCIDQLRQGGIFSLYYKYLDKGARIWGTITFTHLSGQARGDKDLLYGQDPQKTEYPIKTHMNPHYFKVYWMVPRQIFLKKKSILNQIMWSQKSFR